MSASICISLPVSITALFDNLPSVQCACHHAVPSQNAEASGPAVWRLACRSPRHLSHRINWPPCFCKPRPERKQKQSEIKTLHSQIRKSHDLAIIRTTTYRPRTQGSRPKEKQHMHEQHFTTFQPSLPPFAFLIHSREMMPCDATDRFGGVAYTQSVIYIYTYLTCPSLAHGRFDMAVMQPARAGQHVPRQAVKHRPRPTNVSVRTRQAP
ncbi:hypothetical protein B0T25DRAFT_336206 [Lasiosphaeria hispida]|uniref:Uncharacterized protein n=1 Tax=Lasiosphaeria hispida TaxID=260671 RepID=A0AAJ0H6J6_9PEZI|nr:hypothetical protein B0T25DRAFT_336206 [Lasiosphaeria hispida]